MTRDMAARSAYLDQIREMFVDSARLPAAPTRKGEQDQPHIYNSITATGGGSDA